MTRSELNLTLAILRSAELGFLGFMMPTRRHTPFMQGRFPSDSAGDTGLRARFSLRQPRSTWLKVAQRRPSGAAGSVGATNAGILGIAESVIRLSALQRESIVLAGGMVES